MNCARSVVVSGVGLISPLGDSMEALGAALTAGACGLTPVEAGLRGQVSQSFTPRSHPLDGDWPAVGAVTDFAAGYYLGEGNLRPLDRPGQLVAAAAALALNEAGIHREECHRRDVGLVLGTMFGSVHTISAFDRRAVTAGPNYAKPMDFANTVINAPAGQTAIWHGLVGVNSTVSAGTSSGLLAILHAAQLIEQGRCEVLLAGGGDELCAESLVGFGQAGLLAGGWLDDACDSVAKPCAVPFDRRRNGFALAEGAALLVLEEEGAARRRGACIRGWIRGAANRFDPSRGQDPERGRTVVAGAIREALSEAGWEAEAVDAVSASANGSVAGDRTEARALCDVFGPSLPAMAVKSMIGEAQGASGALQTAGLMAAMCCGILPGIHGLEELESELPESLASARNRAVELRRGLVTSVGIDGHVGALLVEKARHQKAMEVAA